MLSRLFKWLLYGDTSCNAGEYGNKCLNPSVRKTSLGWMCAEHIRERERLFSILQEAESIRNQQMLKLIDEENTYENS